MSLIHNKAPHTTSVNKSVKESIKKLGNAYGNQIASKEVDIILEEILKNIETFILNLEKDKLSKENNPECTDILLDITVLEAAQRCIEGLKQYKTKKPQENYEVKDNSRYYELALAWGAIHDNDKRIGSLEDAKKQIITGLYDIQRGNNIDTEGNDDNQPDRPVCATGVEHKLIERLQGVHPDVKIIYKTPESASAKLLCVVKEIALEYLKENPGFMEKVREDENVESIWKDIKEQVANIMFEEFGDVPQFLTNGRLDKNNKKFRDMIEAGIDVPIVEKDLERAPLAGPSSTSIKETEVEELGGKSKGL